MSPSVQGSPATRLRASGFSSKQQRRFVDALRGCLGLAPLYAADQTNKASTFDPKPELLSGLRL